MRPRRQRGCWPMPTALTQAGHVSQPVACPQCSRQPACRHRERPESQDQVSGRAYCALAPQGSCPLAVVKVHHCCCVKGTEAQRGKVTALLSHIQRCGPGLTLKFTKEGRPRQVKGHSQGHPGRRLPGVMTMSLQASGSPESRQI